MTVRPSFWADFKTEYAVVVRRPVYRWIADVLMSPGPTRFRASLREMSRRALGPAA